ncbi:hypothetical protein HK104_010864 [Borealophlyctis nickersoniae]|nr:hypothetical protein HK104_010864 [Borealophlyctis nickersoniae]
MSTYLSYLTPAQRAGLRAGILSNLSAHAATMNHDSLNGLLKELRALWTLDVFPMQDRSKLVSAIVRFLKAHNMLGQPSLLALLERVWVLACVEGGSAAQPPDPNDTQRLWLSGVGSWCEREELTRIILHNLHWGTVLPLLAAHLAGVFPHKGRITDYCSLITEASAQYANSALSVIVPAILEEVFKIAEDASVADIGLIEVLGIIIERLRGDKEFKVMLKLTNFIVDHCSKLPQPDSRLNALSLVDRSQAELESG